VVFVPFHYGYWDTGYWDTEYRDTGYRDAPDIEPERAANELTITAWDPVSKQPLFKSAAVRVIREGPGSGPAPAPSIGGSAPSTATGKEA